MHSLLKTVLVAMTAAPISLAAQSEDVAPLLVRLPMGARPLAMGNVGVASRDDDVLFYNPAQLTFARGMSVSAEQFSPTARTGALSTVTRFNTGGVAIGASVAQFNVPPASYPVTRTDLVTGGPVTASEASLVVGFAQVIKSTRIGVAAKYVEETIGASRASGPLYDVGLGREFFGYSFGLSVQNLGEAFTPSVVPTSSFLPPIVHLPFRATFGVLRGKSFDQVDVAATAAVSTLRDGFVIPAGGAELTYSWLDGYVVQFRAGARRPEPGEGTITAGAGLTVDRLTLDYALETLSGSRVAHRIGLRIR
jgi:hypothetical protein